MEDSSTTSPIRPHKLGLKSTASPLAALRLAGQGAELAGIAIVARRYGTSDFGVISVAYVIARYLGLIADRGASLTGARDFTLASNPWSEVRARLNSRTRTASLLASAFILAAVVVEPELAPLGVCVFARGLNRDWIALAQHRGTRAGIPNAAQGVCLAILVTVAATGSVTFATMSIAIANVIGLTLSLCLNRLSPPRGDRTDLHRFAARDIWPLTIVLADQVVSAADLALMSTLGSTASAGLYAAAYRFPNGWTLAQGLIVSGLVPGMTSAILRSPQEYSELRRRCLRAGALAAAACIAMIPLVSWLLVVVFGTAFAGARGPLVILMIAAATSTATIGLFPIVAATGRERPLAITFIAVATGNVSLNILVIPQFGMMGAATVTLVSQIVLGGAYLRLTAARPSPLSATTPFQPTASPLRPLSSSPNQLIQIDSRRTASEGDVSSGRSSRQSIVPDTPSIDVVILTWNDGALLQRAIDSVRHSKGVSVRCTVVDNGSDEPVSIRLDAEDEMIRLVANFGVAAGRNIGARVGGAPLVCFLDSDAVLHADTLAVLARALAADPGIGLAAPVFDGQQPTDSGGLAPTLVRKVRRLLGRTSAYDRGHEHDGLIDVDFAIGACQLFRRSAFQQVGGLDERYFYGPEDADFCMRLRRAGWRVVQVPAAGCEHPPRRRNRRILSVSGARHAGAVMRFLWRHRSYRQRVPNPRLGGE